MYQRKFSLASPRLHEATFLSSSVLDVRVQADLERTALQATFGKENIRWGY
jgi:hypothetical protein